MATCHSAEGTQHAQFLDSRGPFLTEKVQMKHDKSLGLAAAAALEGDAETEIDRLLALPAGALLPLVLDESGVVDDAAFPAAPPLLAADGRLFEEEKPIFTELEAELLLASLEDPEIHAAPPVAAADKPKKPKIPSRKRQLEEMKYLRAQVVELETALNQTKEAHSESGGAAEKGVLTDVVWEQIAQRQLEEKRRAEIENIKLRSVLEGQLRIAHSLEKLLTKRSLTDAEPFLDASKRPRIAELLPPSETVAWTPDLARQLAQLDAVMEDSELAGVGAAEIDECQIKTDDQNQIFLERTFTKLLPFPLHQTGDAAWRRLTPARLDLSNGCYGTTRRSECDYDVEFSVMTKVRRASARCVGRGAGRRQQTPDKRDVVVWQIRAGLNGQALTGHSVGMLDYGHLVIEPVTSACGVPSCILKTCVRIWPQLAESELDKLGLFVDLTLSTFNENVKTILQLIENDLLEQSLTNPPTANA